MLQLDEHGAERRIRLFRLAWDYVGSELGSRSELYERFYLSDSWRMTALAYQMRCSGVCFKTSVSSMNSDSR